MIIQMYPLIEFSHEQCITKHFFWVYFIKSQLNNWHSLERKVIHCFITNKVAGRVLDRKYEVHGKDINATVNLDSDIYNPVYETKTEFRENNIPPSSTIMFKVNKTVDSTEKFFLFFKYFRFLIILQWLNLQFHCFVSNCKNIKIVLNCQTFMISNSSQLSEN